MRNLVDTIDSLDAVYHPLQLAYGLHHKLDVTDGYAVDILGCQGCHRKMQLVGNAVDKVNHKVVAVDTLHANLHGIEEGRVSIKRCRHDRVAILRSKADDIWTVALMQDGITIALYKSYNLILG